MLFLQKKNELKYFSTIFLYLGLCSFLASCSDLPYRSFQDEMERDDSPSLVPSKDFPVVSGDTGRDWLNEDERRLRTPAAFSLEEKPYQRNLFHELKQLESSLDFEEERYYLAIKHKLKSVSEKIYFLRLTFNEKKMYLSARGFVLSPSTSFSKTSKLENEQISVGMTKNDVMSFMGRPVRVDVAGHPQEENERWLYDHHPFKFVFFEGGRVHGWQ